MMKILTYIYPFNVISFLYFNNLWNKISYFFIWYKFWNDNRMIHTNTI